LDPPTLSPSIIKNLGATFCNINPDKLAVEKLSKTKSKKADSTNEQLAPGGKKQAKSKSNPDSTNDVSQATNKKKPKKK
jgi:hypothetical protein